MNVSALFGIRWIAKSTASSFGLGLGAIPAWVLFAFIFSYQVPLFAQNLQLLIQEMEGFMNG